MQRSKDSNFFVKQMDSRGKLRKKDILELSKLGISERDIKSYNWSCKSVKFEKKGDGNEKNEGK